MFNFTTIFKTKKHTFEVRNVKNSPEIFQDGEEKTWPDIDARNANLFIKQLKDIIEKQANKININSFDFKNLLAQLSYFVKGTELLTDLKKINCGYGRRSSNSALDDLKEEVRGIRVDLFNKIKIDNYSYAQQIVIDRVADYMPKRIMHYEMKYWYDAANDSTSVLDNFMKEVRSFNYKEYGYTKASVIAEIEEVYKSVLELVKDFRALVKEVGDDLINWSQHKISRRLTTLNINQKYWSMSEYIESYCEMLRKKGVKPENKKKSSKEKLADKIVAKQELSQEEYFKYFKQANATDANRIVDNLDLKTIYLILDSELKCVKEKIYDRFGEPITNCAESISLRAQKLTKTKTDFNKIFKWSSIKYLDWEFIKRHQDHISNKQLIEFCKSHDCVQINSLLEESFFQKCFTKLPEPLKVSYQVTYNFMKRMSDEEKINVLKDIDSIAVSSSTLYNLYHNVDYSKIKDTIKSNDTLKQYLCLKVAKENDSEMVVDCLKSIGPKLDRYIKRTLFAKLSYSQKKEVIRSDVVNLDDKEERNIFSNHFSNNQYYGAIHGMTQEERLDLLEMLLEHENIDNYVIAIFKKEAKNITPEIKHRINKLVQDKADLGCLPLNETTLKLLTNKTKVVLLQTGNEIPLKSYYNGYGRSYSADEKIGDLFFASMKRASILKVFESVLHNPYTMFVAHVMENEELITASLASNTFFRKHLDKLPYSFLKQYKNKDKFKEVVGDCRNRSNKYFGQRLAEKLNISNAMDFILEA